MSSTDDEPGFCFYFGNAMRLIIGVSNNFDIEKMTHGCLIFDLIILVLP